MSNLSFALAYAAKGWRVFPCQKSKQPLEGSNGFKDATQDSEQIKKWWSVNPEYSIGIATGPDSGVWVLDVDLPDGPNTVKLWNDQGLIIPTTLEQRTGGGGNQCFFKWNGREVRNSTKKIGPGIDIRGNGGYVIVPPSGHPTGGTYQWLKRMEPQLAPDWLYDLIEKAKEKAPEAVPGRSTKYGEAALAKEITELSHSTEGSRNDSLNTSAYSLGQLIGGGELDQGQVEIMLLGIAISLGLKQKEAKATINSGILSGMQTPRSNPYSEDINTFDQNDHNDMHDTGSSSFDQSLIKLNNSQETQAPYNLMGHIGQWLDNSGGSFTNDQIDREFNLTTRQQKLNRSQCLYIYKEKNRIRADKTIKGKWHVIDNTIEWVSLKTADESPFPIKLPFNLHELVHIPKHSIIILAGSSNAGKTSLIFNALKLNMSQEYTKMYLMSEMSDGEYKDRLLSGNEDIDEWDEKIKAAERTFDFNGTIQHHNPDGLTCVDYLEEVEGEFAKIPSSIRDIYDALGDGVAIVAIQKNVGSDIARGGQGTKDKARLYITLDFLCAMEHCIICAIKLTKVKKSLKGNMQDKELHFRIERGMQLTVMKDWEYSSKVNRQKCIKEYSGGDEGSLFSFNTVDGDTVTLNERDYTAWSRKYTSFDLDKELARVADYSTGHPWLKKKNWFFQLGAHLDKKERGE